MRLGTETASMTNHLQSRATKGQPTPTVGMGATILGWTDRYPATIVEVLSVGKTVVKTVVGVQEDDYKRIDKNGMSESQDYEFTPNKNASVRYWRADEKDGAWRSVTRNEKGRFVLSGGNGLRIGERDKYHDFSF